jgi:uncharacterized protein (TIGR03905 family)
MHYEYITEGTCSKKIDFDLIDGKVSNVKFTGGCNGNLKAISSLVEGLTPQEIIAKCEGIECGIKKTSCADQLSKAMRKIEQ